MAADTFFEDLAVGMRFGSPTRSVRADEVTTFLDFIGDWQNRWGSVFEPRPALHSRGPEALDVAPGLLLLAQQWGYQGHAAALTGIVATYKVESIAHTAPLPVGDPYRVDSEVTALEPLPDGFGNVLTRREVVRSDGTVCFSLVEKARFRTREAWESGTG